MTWNLGAKTEDAAFAFVPPKDSTKIAMADTESFRQQQQQQPQQTRKARRSPNPNQREPT